MTDRIELSIVVPITERDRAHNIRELYSAYKPYLEQLNKQYEIIYVIDGNFPKELKVLQKLREEGEKIKILKLAKWFGESTALTAGFERSSGELILTLPAYPQIEESEIPKLLNSLSNNDMLIACRWPRIDSLLNRIQNRAFHRLVKWIIGFSFKDLGSGVRLFKRRVIDEIQIYGDQHRFFPLLAVQRGFKVREIEVKQSPKNVFRRIYPFGIYLRRVLDLLAIFFLIKFTKKPLRFFGLSGFLVFAIGAVLSVYILIERVFLGVALADRPIVLLALLLVVLGIQIFAIGLIGEIIIFTHAKELREYSIDEVTN